MTEIIELEKKVLSENDRLASAIRNQLKAHHITALNFVSSPGSGKTSLLEKTLGALKDQLRIALIAGDVQTENDANRLIRAGGEMVKPMVTHDACHLEANMISGILPEFDLDKIDLLSLKMWGIWSAPPATIWVKI